MLVYCVIVFIKQLMMLDVTNSQMQTSPAVAVLLVVMLSVTAAKPGQLEVVVLGAGEECEGGVELGAGDGARYCVIRAEHWGRGRAGAGHILTCSAPDTKEGCSCGEAGATGDQEKYPWIALGKSLKVWKVINSNQ